MKFTFWVKTIFVFVMLVTANFAFAEMVKNAGFTGKTILVSNNAPVVGDTVRMSMPIYNETKGTLYGNVRLYENGKKMGEKAVILKIGEFGGFSYEWKAVPGSHDFVLKLEDTFVQEPKKEKVIVVLENREAEITLRSQGSGSSIIDSAPDLFKEYTVDSEEQTAPGDSGIDSIRQDFASNAEAKINSIKQDINESVKQNAEYEKRLNALRESLPRADGSVLTPLQYLYAWALGALAYILSNAYLFYGIVILIGFWILRFIFRKFRHGHHGLHK